MSYLSIVQQGMRFGLVGIVATLTHVLIYIALVEATGTNPSAANAIAFVIAFAVSFVGHFRWTFATAHGANRRPWGRPLLKFTLVALFGFLLNALAVYVVTDVAQASYLYATIFMLLVTPISVFLLSRLWAFS